MTTQKDKNTQLDTLNELLGKANYSRGMGEIKNDLWQSLKSGLVGVPQAGVGIANLISGGHAGKFIQDHIWDMQKTQENIQAQKSDTAKMQQKQFDNAEGFGGKLGAIWDNPMMAVDAATQSTPQMLAGGLVGRGIGKLAGIKNGVVRGAVGEGTVMAGSASETMRSEDGLLTGKEMLASIGTGVLGAGLGYGGGKLAQKLGISDADTLLAGGVRELGENAGKGGFTNGLKGIGKGAVAEGVFEELPQTLTETALDNWANDRALTENMAGNAAMGLAAGAVMGGAVGGVSGWRGKKGGDDNNQNPPIETVIGEEIAPTDDSRTGVTIDENGNEVVPERWAEQSQMLDDNATPRPVSGLLENAGTPILDKNIVLEDGTILHKDNPNAYNDWLAYEREQAIARRDENARRGFNDITPIPTEAVAYGLASNLNDHQGVTPPLLEFAGTLVNQMADKGIDVHALAGSQDKQAHLTDILRNADPRSFTNQANFENWLNQNEYINQFRDAQRPQTPQTANNALPSETTAMTANEFRGYQALNRGLVQDFGKRLAQNEPVSQKPSEQLGLDPNAGALSRSAVVAVDSGASPVGQALQNTQQSAYHTQRVENEQGTGRDDERIIDFKVNPLRYLDDIVKQGRIKDLFKKAKVRSATAFSELPISKQANAFEQLLKDGYQPQAWGNDEHNADLNRQMREAQIKHNQTTSTLKQKNGKPFKSEKSAEQALLDYGVEDTHEIIKDESGFVLRRLPPAKQDELRRKKLGIPSYVEAQEMAINELGLSDKLIQNDHELSDDEWQQVERYAHQILDDFKVGSQDNQQQTQDTHGYPASIDTENGTADFIGMAFDGDGAIFEDGNGVRYKKYSPNSKTIAYEPPNSTAMPLRAGYLTQTEYKSPKKPKNLKDGLQDLKAKVGKLPKTAEQKKDELVNAFTNSVNEKAIANIKNLSDNDKAQLDEIFDKLDRHQNGKPPKEKPHDDTNRTQSPSDRVLDNTPTASVGGDGTKRETASIHSKSDKSSARRDQEQSDNRNDTDRSTELQSDGAKTGVSSGVDFANHRGKTDLDTLYQVANSRNDGNKSFANVAKVNDETAQKIQDITGIDVTGFDIGIDESSIRHTLKEHGDEASERKRGQTAVVEQDFGLVADIVNNADDIKKGDVDNTLIFEKKLGNSYVVVQELRIGKGKLSLKTMYKKGLTSVLVAPDQSQSTAETPETSGSLALDGSLPKSNNSVNTALSTTNTPTFALSDEMVQTGSVKDKLATNIAIIELLKQLEHDKRQPTNDEKALMAKYTGFGGLANAFPDSNGDYKKGFETLGIRLRQLLSRDEYENARASSTSAFFTPPTVVSAMWDIAKRLGYNGGVVLEPSAGVGAFIGHAPKNLPQKIIGTEIDPITAAITNHLYPHASIFNQGYETLSLPDNSVDLAIGNPPYGGVRLNFKDKPHLSGKTIANSFMQGTLEQVKPNGLSVMVVSSSFMDSTDASTRKAMAELGELVGAVRLPDTTFGEAGTAVVADILVFKKHDEATLQAYKDGKNTDYPSWVQSGKRTDKDGTQVNFNPYFDDKIVGEFEFGRGEGGRAVYTVKETDKLDKVLDKFVKSFKQIKSTRTAKEIQDEIDTHTKAMVDSLTLYNMGETAGFIGRENGVLVQVIEQESGNPNANRIVKRALSPSSVWSDSFMQDLDGRWYKLEDKKDENGKPIKAKGKDGKALRVNEKTKVYYDEKDIHAQSKLGVRGMNVLNQALAIQGLIENQLRLEQEGATDGEIENNRKALNDAYDNFVKTFGYLNNPKNTKYIDKLPKANFILALEKSYKKEVAIGIGKNKEIVEPETTGKADILSKRVLVPKTQKTHADSPQDALSLSLAYTSRVDLDLMSELTGQSKNELTEKLTATGELYFDPDTDSYVIRDEYLSGNVRQKLADAKQHGLTSNIKALEQVLPKDVEIENISIRLGMNWLPTQIYSEFAQKLLGNGSATIDYEPLTHNFSINGSASHTAMNEFGAGGKSPEWILERILNSKPIRVTKTTGKETVFLPTETQEANDMAKTIKAEFENFIYSHPQIDKIAKLYNEKHNAVVPRKYDGSHLELVGKVPDDVIKLRTHQMNAVWRGVTTNAVLYDHAVGAGKTMVSIARAMERKRLGLSKKPVLVVPNHMIEQFAKEIYQLYPSANILTAGTKDFAKAKRKRLFGQIATGDYDIIVLPHSSFEFIKLSKERQRAMLNQERDKLIDAISQEKQRQGKKENLKQLEQAKKNIDTKLQRLSETNRHDDEFSFEQMGIDDITVDEAHEFKNLFFTTKMQGVKGLGNPAGSNKAMDLWLKTQYLHEVGGSVAFMTGTPISNSAAEMHAMMRYLMPDTLEQMGLDNFDAWANTYAENTAKFEATEGGQLKLVTRFAREWQNMGSLMSLWKTITDSVTNDDIKKTYKEETGKEFPLPQVDGGTRKSVVVKPTVQQEQILQMVLAGFAKIEAKEMGKEEAQKLRLQLMDLATKNALDPRTINPSLDAGGKIGAVVDNVFSTYQKWNEDKGTQIIFLDRSTPKGKGDDKKIAEYEALLARRENAIQAENDDDLLKVNELLDKFDENEMAELISAKNGGFNAYDEIKKGLIAKGIPADEIAFIQEAETDDEKRELFDKVNAGRVRVIIGSSQRMGAGTNIQKRLVALHHMDAPWKPSDIEQREGRIIRQGNELYEKHGHDTFKVEINAYVTEKTADAKRWDTMAAKLVTINAIRHYKGEHTLDFGDDEENASFAEIAALATGNPLMRERVELTAQKEQLERSRLAHQKRDAGNRTKFTQAQTASQSLPKKIKSLEQAKADYDTLLPKAQAEFDKIGISIDGKWFTTRKDAGEYLDNKAKQANAEGKKVSYVIDGESVGSLSAATDRVRNTPLAKKSATPTLITVGNKTHSTIGEAVNDEVIRQVNNHHNDEPIAKIMGFDVRSYDMSKKTLLAVETADGYELTQTTLDNHATFEKVENALSRLANTLAKNMGNVITNAQNELVMANDTIKQLQDKVGQGFLGEQELTDVTKRLNEVQTLLSDDGSESQFYDDDKFDDLMELLDSRAIGGSLGKSFTPTAQYHIAESQQIDSVDYDDLTPSQQKAVDALNALPDNDPNKAALLQEVYGTGRDDTETAKEQRSKITKKATTYELVARKTKEVADGLKSLGYTVKSSKVSLKDDGYTAQMTANKGDRVLDVRVHRMMNEHRANDPTKNGFFVNDGGVQYSFSINEPSIAQGIDSYFEYKTNGNYGKDRPELTYTDGTDWQEKMRPELARLMDDDPRLHGFVEMANNEKLASGYKNEILLALTAYADKQAIKGNAVYPHNISIDGTIDHSQRQIRQLKQDKPYFTNDRPTFAPKDSKEWRERMNGQLARLFDDDPRLAELTEKANNATTAPQRNALMNDIKDYASRQAEQGNALFNHEVIERQNERYHRGEMRFSRMGGVVAPLAKQAKVLQGEPIAIIDESTLDMPQEGGFNAIQKWATELFARQGGKAVNPTLGEVVLNHRSVKDSLAHGKFSPFKNVAFAGVKDVLEKGVVIAQDINEFKEESFYISAPVTMNSKENIITVTVHKDSNSQRMYLHGVMLKENLLKPRVSATLEKTSRTHYGSLTSADIHNILQNALTYKGGSRQGYGERTGLFDLPPMPITTINAKDLGFTDTKKLADEILRQLQGTNDLINDDTGWVLGKKDRKKMGDNENLSHATSQAVQGLNELVKNAVVAETHADIKHENTDVKAVHRLYAPAMIDGQLYRVKLTVKDYILTDGQPRKNLHAIEAVEIENALLGTLPSNLWIAQPTTEHSVGVADLLNDVKRDGDNFPFGTETKNSKQGAKFGTTADEVLDVLNKRFGKDTIAKLQANNSLKVLSLAQAREQFGAIHDNVDGFYTDGTAYLIHDNIHPEMIVPTFLHELGGHGGLQTLMSDRAYQGFMNEFDELVKKGDKLAVKAKALADKNTNSQAQNEYLPYLITLASRQKEQQGKIRSLINRMMMAVKTFIRQKLGINLPLTPNEIVAVAEKAVRDRADGQVVKVGDLQYSLNEGDDSDFVRAVDDVFANDVRIKSKMIELGQTPKAFVQAGLDNVPIFIDKAKLAKIKADHPEMTADLLKQIPKQLNNPVAIFKNTKENAPKNSYVALTELVAENGDSVIVAIHANKTHNGLEFNKIASIYGRNSSKLYLKNMVRFADVRFVDKQKANRVALELQLLDEDTLSLLFDKAIIADDKTLDNLDIQFSRMADFYENSVEKTKKTVESLNKTAQEFIKNPKDFVKTGASNKKADHLGKFLQFLGRRQLTDLYGKKLQGLKDYNEMVAQMDADSNENAFRADTLVNKWAKVKDDKELAELMHDVTLSSIDPSKPKEQGVNGVQYGQLKARYDRLSDTAKEVFNEARDDYQAHYENLHRAMVERIQRNDKLSDKRKNKLIAELDKELQASKKAFFPLTRFGDYVVVVRDTDGNVVNISRAETKGQADALRQQLIKDNPNHKVGQVTLGRDVDIRTLAGIKGLASEFLNNDLGLDDALHQDYLNALLDREFATNNVMVKNVAGFSQNARRAYAHHMSRGANHIAKLRHTDRLKAKLDEMQAYIDNSDDDVIELQRVMDEMNKRHALLLNPPSHPVSSLATAVGFMWYMGLSPASAIVNLSQTLLVAMPMMSAKYGFTKSNKMLGEISALLAKNKNDLTSVLTGDEKKAFDEAVRRGVIDMTQAHDLAGVANGENSMVMEKIKPVMKVASLMFHQAEKFNRQVTFVASYRLAIQKGLTSDEAMEQAINITYDGHFDYASSNRPRFMQGNWQRVLFLFKQYGQNMVYTLARNSYLSFKGETPEVKREARKILAGILTGHAVTAGVLGLPMVSTLLAMASALGGDDEPWDAEVALRNQLAELLGDDVAQVLTKGLPRAIGVDLSSRVGLDSLILPRLQDGLEGQRLGENLVVGLAGPVLNIPVSMSKGLSQIGQGQTLQGVENMLPKALRDPLKAYRYEMYGNVDKSGIEIVERENVSAWDTAQQLVGFRSGKMAQAGEVKSAIYQADKELTAIRKSLVDSYARAYRDGDMTTADEIWERITRFNAKNPSVKITKPNLMKSVHERNRRIESAKDGVYLNKNREHLREYGVFGF